MRQALLTLIMMFTALFGVVSPTYAASPTAANIFGTIGGTTTIDQGGAIHSQTRSIYSLGGGMSSFKGKRVTLLAADAPSFSAGCSGISWHFGGFSFISVDEIRQLVEAVSQASLGIAVDLAMQTLCPQCYAVMSKLRDISNAMRNAAADSCKIAKNFGAMLKDSGIFSADGMVGNCSETSSEANTSGSWLQAGMGLCKTINGATSTMLDYGTKVEKYLNGTLSSSEKTPSKDKLDLVGNVTYNTLTALGYEDGFIKNFLLSYTGMAIVPAKPVDNCASTLASIRGTADATGSTESQALDKLFDKAAADQNPKTVQATTAGSAPKPTDANNKAANPEASGGTKGVQVCYAPPLITGIQALGERIVCGLDANADAKRFATKFQMDATKISSTSLGAMCRTSLSLDATAGSATQAYKDQYVYSCPEAASEKCMKPKLVKLETAINKDANGASQEYTGLAWMIMDALHQGVRSVRNNQPLPAATLSILNGSGYPLYRLINLAAVYPGMTDELLFAYGSIIATHYAMDTLDKMTRPGNTSQVNLQGAPGGMKPTEVNDMRYEIMRMVRDATPVREEVLKRLNEKRALIDLIVQVNRSLQADVISQGLMGNANLAVSLKKQQAVAP